MMNSEKNRDFLLDKVLTGEQEEILDLYVTNLDNIFEEMKLSEKTQIEIETMHLKKILSS